MKKKTHKTRSTDFSEIAKIRFPIRHRQMRIFYQKNEIYKFDNNTKRHQNGSIFFQLFLIGQFLKIRKIFKISQISQIFIKVLFGIF